MDPVLGDDLDVRGRTADARGNAGEWLTEGAEAAGRYGGCLSPEGVVDGPTELIADCEVGDSRGQYDRDPYGGSGDERNPASQRHRQSLRT